MGFIIISPFSLIYPFLYSSFVTMEYPFEKSFAEIMELSRFETTSHFPFIIEIPFPFNTARAMSFSLNAEA